MKAKVLFVIHDVYQDDNDFPLGPAYLASVLLKRGVDVEIYNQDIFHYANDHLAEYLDDHEFDVIGLGFLAARYKETIEPLCKTINDHKRDAWLVLGGHGVSAIPKYILEQTQADIAVIGEGENTIVDLVQCKISDGDLSKVRGIVYRSGTQCIENQRRESIKQLDSIPFPAWEIFPIDIYQSCSIYPGQQENEKIQAIITTRGCTNSCAFCYRMEKGIRRRSLPNIIAEMKILIERYGVSYFFIADELTFINRSMVFDFEEALDRAGLKIKYYCDIRATLVDNEVVQSLKRSGCQLVNIGFESMDQKVLDALNKGTTVEENINAAEICKNNGLVMGLNIIWANPYDSEQSLWKLVDFIKKYNTYGQTRTIRPVTPYPGSPLYTKAVASGMLDGPNGFFAKFKNSDLITVNFTDIPTEECYKLLFAANTELILDHFLHTSQNMDEAKILIDSFYRLYFEGDYKFRGARHYKKDEQQT